MHALIAIITKRKPTENVIDNLMSPYDESLEIDFNDEDEYWYNPRGMWDWYNICRWDAKKFENDGSRYGSEPPFTEISVKISDLLDNAKKVIERDVTEEDYPEDYQTWQRMIAGEEQYYSKEYCLEHYPKFTDYMLAKKDLAFYSVLVDGEWTDIGSGFVFTKGCQTDEILEFIEKYLEPNRDCWITVANYHF